MASPGTKRRLQQQAEMSAENKRLSGAVRAAKAESAASADRLARVLKDAGSEKQQLFG
jgi:hypothetical protein